MNKILFLVMFAASCCNSDKIDHKSVSQRRQEQPEALFLPANTVVKTTKGDYISGSVVEIWHSEKTVEKLEQKISKFIPQP
jgi:hypothetical protein